ncbi:MAG: zinc-finger-containing protein [Pseudomonadota bacterium]
MKTCRYCLKPAVLLKFGDEGYPYQWDYGPVWNCAPCHAYVGCHPGTENALGGLANAELREMRQKAHAAFDPLWKGKMRRDKMAKGPARRAGYRWLSEQLGIPVKKTHIAYMNLGECERVIEVCNAVHSKEKK